MRTRISILAVVLPLMCLAVAVPAARAQGPCYVDTFTGTYVFYEHGSSAILDPNQGSPYLFHWVGSVAPFVTVGQVTMWPNGTGEGFYWIRVGWLNGGADPIPLTMTVTEINPDCTGKITYSLTLPGNPVPTTIVERIIFFDNGREFRTIPTEIFNGITSLAWIGEGHRLTEGHAMPQPCGPQTARGAYLMSAENLVRMGPNPVLADTALLRFDVSMDGELTGTLYEKLGPTGNIELPMSGTLAVADDCSFVASINVTILGVPKTIPLRGIFFDQGKKLYGLNVASGPGGTQWSFGRGQRIIR